MDRPHRRRHTPRETKPLALKQYVSLFTSWDNTTPTVIGLFTENNPPIASLAEPGNVK